LALFISIALPLSVATSKASDSGAERGTFKGIVAPARTYEFAPSSGGKVLKIHFVPGQWVEKGALLFTMDGTEEELELERDQAKLLRAEAELRDADAGFKSNAVLHDKSVVSDRQYREFEKQRDIATAAAAEARVQVKGDELKIKGLKLYAPFSGIMSPPPSRRARIWPNSRVSKPAWR
jgi:multidrug efflux pump subunit AcrA (membrane-fusion protein)